MRCGILKEKERTESTKGKVNVKMCENLQRNKFQGNSLICNLFVVIFEV